MKDIRITGPLAREMELRQEFYNKCHDQGGRFCEGDDGPGRARDNRKLKGRFDGEAGETYRNMLENREALEQYYTPGLEALARENGGKLEGLDFRFKSDSSIQSRINRNLEKEPGWSESDAINALGDTLRYTMTFPEDRYAEGVANAIKEIKDAGIDFEENKVMSSWGPNGQYAGINSTMVDRDSGFKTELQFHTPESFRAKEELHKEYEYLRELNGSNEDRYQTWRKMTDRTNEVPRPSNWEELEGSTVNGVYLKPKNWNYTTYMREQDEEVLYASAQKFPDPKKGDEINGV